MRWGLPTTDYHILEAELFLRKAGRKNFLSTENL